MKRKTILVCCGTGCLANGSQKVFDTFASAVGSNIKLKKRTESKRVGCNGFCENGPIVTILPDNITYYKVKPDDVLDIVNSLKKKNQAVERLLYKDETGKVVRSREENPFYAPQLKIALRNTGLIDPANIEDYIARGGYDGLKKALKKTGDEIISEIERSGLRGRGGAGFPTGRKWRSCYEVESEEKYMLCNGDEGDPGAFMDRSILEGDPHSVLEGLIIGALAIGANKGFFYIRDEYALALSSVQTAIDAARAKGFLGKNILNSNRSFDVEIVRGGGAFVCGESSALMASIEGRVGEPRVKYIRSTTKGLFDKPTVLNNVETLANVPYILSFGAQAFANIGTEGSKGTKVFSLVGKVCRTGLVEVPMGATISHIVCDIGGGVPDGGTLKAVQTGGPSGGCIPKSMFDLPVDFDSLTEKGSMMGSGGIIVLDTSTCMVELARYYVSFLAGESCGKCTPCREGLRCMGEILNRICEGQGTVADLDLLRELCETTRLTSLCELGRSAPNPVLSTLQYFEDEYLAHIQQKTCPAGVCPTLISFAIIQEKCKGCGLCAKKCPTKAISGELKGEHTIDQSKCVKCGVCLTTCKFNAVERK